MPRKEIVYKTGDDAHVISIVPDLALDEEFWEERAEGLARTSHRSSPCAELDDPARISQQLVMHEVRMHPGLRIERWSRELVLECVAEYNPKKHASPNLPSDYLYLALAGRLKGWKLCTIKAYSSEVWLCFYNMVFGEWQSGILRAKADKGDGRLNPFTLIVQESSDKRAEMICYLNAAESEVDTKGSMAADDGKTTDEDSDMPDYVTIVKEHDTIYHDVRRKIVMDGYDGVTVHEYINDRD